MLKLATALHFFFLSKTHLFCLFGGHACVVSQVLRIRPASILETTANRVGLEKYLEVAHDRIIEWGKQNFPFFKFS